MSALPAGVSAARTCPPAPLRVVPIPVTEPLPRPATWQVPEHDRQAGGYVQGTLAVDFRSDHEDSYFGPQATTRADLPDPADWSARLLRLVLESMDGLRPAGQVQRWVSTAIHERVVRRGTLSRQRGRTVRHATVVKVLRVCEPADGVAEAAVLVVHDTRVRAVALRLVGVDGRWVMTALEVG